MVFKDGHIVYKEVVNSGKLGDKDITDETIFPIWSMSKPITTVAMMILLDRGLYKLDDNLAKYLPEYENIKCKGEDGVYPCKNKIRVIDLLTHRSGYQYYTFDFNNDNIINVIDIIYLINIILGTESELSSADVNQDGSIDILDVMQLINIILNN